MIVFQIYMTICILFLAGKDVISYKLKSRIDNDLSYSRIKRFHRDGAFLNILFIVPFIYFDPYNWGKYVLYTTLIRISIFDPFFNCQAGLNFRFLGSTALWDKIFIKIFGINGAIKKSLFFIILLVITNILIRS